MSEVPVSKNFYTRTATDAGDKWEVCLEDTCISDSVPLRRHQLPGVGGRVVVGVGRGVGSGSDPNKQASAAPMKRGSRR